MTDEPRSYLAFDLGASTSRAFLGTLQGAELEMSELHRFTTPVLEIDDHLYWDLDVMWAELQTRKRERRLHGYVVFQWTRGASTMYCSTRRVRRCGIPTAIAIRALKA